MKSNNKSKPNKVSLAKSVVTNTCKARAMTDRPDFYVEQYLSCSSCTEMIGELAWRFTWTMELFFDEKHRSLLSYLSLL